MQGFPNSVKRWEGGGWVTRNFAGGDFFSPGGFAQGIFFDLLRLL